MTWRIRAYLGVLAFRYIGLAIALMRAPEAFEPAPHFRHIFGIASLEWWAALFIMLGIAAIGAAIRPVALGIRYVLVASVGLTATWAAGFLAAELVDGTRSAMGTIFLLALAAKDLIVASMPLVSPSDTMVRDLGLER
jgi:hypothetical protein